LGNDESEMGALKMLRVIEGLGGDRRTAWLLTLFELTLVVALLLTRD
jgi:hypothetical protein